MSTMYNAVVLASRRPLQGNPFPSTRRLLPYGGIQSYVSGIHHSRYLLPLADKPYNILTRPLGAPAKANFESVPDKPISGVHTLCYSHSHQASDPSQIAGGDLWLMLDHYNSLLAHLRSSNQPPSGGADANRDITLHLRAMLSHGVLLQRESQHSHESLTPEETETLACFLAVAVRRSEGGGVHRVVSDDEFRSLCAAMSPVTFLPLIHRGGVPMSPPSPSAYSMLQSTPHAPWRLGLSPLDVDAEHFHWAWLCGRLQRTVALVLELDQQANMVLGKGERDWGPSLGLLESFSSVLGALPATLLWAKVVQVYLLSQQLALRMAGARRRGEERGPEGDHRTMSTLASTIRELMGSQVEVAGQLQALESVVHQDFPLVGFDVHHCLGRYGCHHHLVVDSNREEATELSQARDELHQALTCADRFLVCLTGTSWSDEELGFVSLVSHWQDELGEHIRALPPPLLPGRALHMRQVVKCALLDIKLFLRCMPMYLDDDKASKRLTEVVKGIHDAVQHGHHNWTYKHHFLSVKSAERQARRKALVDIQGLANTRMDVVMGLTGDDEVNQVKPVLLIQWMRWWHEMHDKGQLLGMLAWAICEEEWVWDPTAEGAKAISDVYLKHADPYLSDLSLWSASRSFEFYGAMLPNCYGAVWIHNKQQYVGGVMRLRKFDLTFKQDLTEPDTVVFMHQATVASWEVGKADESLDDPTSVHDHPFWYGLPWEGQEAVLRRAEEEVGSRTITYKPVTGPLDQASLAFRQLLQSDKMPSSLTRRKVHLLSSLLYRAVGFEAVEAKWWKPWFALGLADCMQQGQGQAQALECFQEENMMDALTSSRYGSLGLTLLLKRAVDSWLEHGGPEARRACLDLLWSALHTTSRWQKHQSKEVASELSEKPHTSTKGGFGAVVLNVPGSSSRITRDDEDAAHHLAWRTWAYTPVHAESCLRVAQLCAEEGDVAEATSLILSLISVAPRAALLCWPQVSETTHKVLNQTTSHGIYREAAYQVLEGLASASQHFVVPGLTWLGDEAARRCIHEGDYEGALKVLGQACCSRSMSPSVVAEVLKTCVRSGQRHLLGELDWGELFPAASVARSTGPGLGLLLEGLSFWGRNYEAPGWQQMRKRLLKVAEQMTRPLIEQVRRSRPGAQAQELSMRIIVEEGDAETLHPGIVAVYLMDMYKRFDLGSCLSSSALYPFFHLTSHHGLADGVNWPEVMTEVVEAAVEEGHMDVASQVVTSALRLKPGAFPLLSEEHCLGLLDLIRGALSLEEVAKAVAARGEAFLEQVLTTSCTVPHRQLLRAVLKHMVDTHHCTPQGLRLLLEDPVLPAAYDQEDLEAVLLCLTLLVQSKVVKERKYWEMVLGAVDREKGYAQLLHTFFQHTQSFLAQDHFKSHIKALISLMIRITHECELVAARGQLVDIMLEYKVPLSTRQASTLMAEAEADRLLGIYESYMESGIKDRQGIPLEKLRVVMTAYLQSHKYEKASAMAWNQDLGRSKEEKLVRLLVDHLLRDLPGASLSTYQLLETFLSSIPSDRINEPYLGPLGMELMQQVASHAREGSLQVRVFLTLLSLTARHANDEGWIAQAVTWVDTLADQERGWTSISLAQKLWLPLMSAVEEEGPLGGRVGHYLLRALMAQRERGSEEVGGSLLEQSCCCLAPPDFAHLVYLGLEGSYLHPGDRPSTGEVLTWVQMYVVAQGAGVATVSSVAVLWLPLLRLICKMSEKSEGVEAQSSGELRVGQLVVRDSLVAPPPAVQDMMALVHLAHETISDSVARSEVHCEGVPWLMRRGYLVGALGSLLVWLRDQEEGQKGHGAVATAILSEEEVMRKLAVGIDPLTHLERVRMVRAADPDELKLDILHEQLAQLYEARSAKVEDQVSVILSDLTYRSLAFLCLEASQGLGPSWCSSFGGPLQRVALLVCAAAGQWSLVGKLGSALRKGHGHVPHEKEERVMECEVVAAWRTGDWKKGGAVLRDLDTLQGAQGPRTRAKVTGTPPHVSGPSRLAHWSPHHLLSLRSVLGVTLSSAQEDASRVEEAVDRLMEAIGDHAARDKGVEQRDRSMSHKSKKPVDMTAVPQYWSPSLVLGTEEVKEFLGNLLDLLPPNQPCVPPTFQTVLGTATVEAVCTVLTRMMAATQGSPTGHSPSGLPPPDVTIYRLAVKIYCRAGALHRAIDLVRMLVQQDCKGVDLQEVLCTLVRGLKGQQAYEVAMGVLDVLVVAGYSYITSWPLFDNIRGVLQEYQEVAGVGDEWEEHVLGHLGAAFFDADEGDHVPLEQALQHQMLPPKDQEKAANLAFDPLYSLCDQQMTSVAVT